MNGMVVLYTMLPRGNLFEGSSSSYECLNTNDGSLKLHFV